MNVSFLGSSLANSGEEDYENAADLGKFFSERGYGLISGGYGGIMEACFSKATGKCTGIVPRIYAGKAPNKYVNEIIETKTYLQRLELLIEKADIIIFFGGASGTVLELMAVWALSDRALTNKRIFFVGNKIKQIVDSLGKNILKVQDYPANFYFFSDSSRVKDFYKNNLKD